MPINHSLESVLSAGFIETRAEPRRELPGLGLLLKEKAHCTFRLMDGLWHCFRYADAAKASKADTAMSQAML
jgi:hypothetical protein